jgi:hypothetical protein
MQIRTYLKHANALQLALRHSCTLQRIRLGMSSSFWRSDPFQQVGYFDYKCLFCVLRLREH